MKEGEYRNDWPLGRVTNTMKSEDGKVRKVYIAIVRDGQKKVMFRSIKELILLVLVGGVDCRQNETNGEKKWQGCSHPWARSVTFINIHIVLHEVLTTVAADEWLESSENVANTLY